MMCTYYLLNVSCFFFSSRRRHTRWPRDWSSDVCSSDLSSLREQYAALHREQSARYLALVESRIDSEPVATAVAAIAALLSAFAILVMMAWNGGNSGVWLEHLAAVLTFEFV